MRPAKMGAANRCVDAEILPSPAPFPGLWSGFDQLLRLFDLCGHKPLNGQGVEDE
jgi:hypothetical protein